VLTACVTSVPILTVKSNKGFFTKFVINIILLNLDVSLLWVLCVVCCVLCVVCCVLCVVGVVCCQVEVSALGLITPPEESYGVWCV